MQKIRRDHSTAFKAQMTFAALNFDSAGSAPPLPHYGQRPKMREHRLSTKQMKMRRSIVVITPV